MQGTLVNGKGIKYLKEYEWKKAVRNRKETNTVRSVLYIYQLPTHSKCNHYSPQTYTNKFHDHLGITNLWRSVCLNFGYSVSASFLW